MIIVTGVFSRGAVEMVAALGAAIFRLQWVNVVASASGKGLQ